MAGRPSQDRKLHFNQNVALRGGWRVGGSVLVETFGYDESLYRDYVVARPPPPTACVLRAYVGTPRLPNLDYVVSFTVPTRKGLDGRRPDLWGRDENFFEWSSADIVFANLGATWRPTDQLRVEGRYQLQSYQRRTDGSYVGHPPHSAAEGRVPGVAADVPAGRRRTERQLPGHAARRLAHQPAGLHPRCARHRPPALRVSTKRLRLDWLFSYQPTPGTVVFAGYGISLDEPDSPAARASRTAARSTASSRRSAICSASRGAYGATSLLRRGCGPELQRGTFWGLPMFQEFKDFIVKGNAFDLAVGVIIGGVFGAVVASLVGDILMPPIGSILGGADFSNMFVTLKDGASPGRMRRWRRPRPPAR